MRLNTYLDEQPAALTHEDEISPLPFLPPCSLSSVPAGRQVRVTLSGDESCSARLRDLGVCEGRQLRVVRRDRAGVIVAVGGGRLALPGEVALRVLVQELA